MQFKSIHGQLAIMIIITWGIVSILLFFLTTNRAIIHIFWHFCFHLFFRFPYFGALLMKQVFHVQLVDMR